VKKPTLLVAMLAMVLVASAPALTQTPSNLEMSPVQKSGAVQVIDDTQVAQPTSAYPDESVEVGPRYIVDCSSVTAPATFCAVDEYGIATLPDGTQLPVEEVSDEPVLDLYTGDLVSFVDGVPVVVQY
jgi:hypothetical protein